MSNVYSFLDVHAAIHGPGGNFPLSGNEAGAAEEGITVDPTGDKNVMTTGADGAYMHSLLGDKSGIIIVRLLRTSRVNAQLQEMFNSQTTSSRAHGRNTITIRDVARGDTITCTGVAFAKQPPHSFAKEAGIKEWTFHAGKIDGQIGSGQPEL